MIIAGVDAGATRVRVILADETGAILARAVGGPGNPTAVGWGMALDNIVSAIRRALEGAGVDAADEAIMSVAYTGWGRYRGVYVERLSREGVARRVTVLEDYRAALITCFPGGKGIVYIMGTGSSCYGSYGGREWLSGGWGHLLGDEGSGYSVGRDGIAEALRSYDGRTGDTVLLRLFTRWSKTDSIHEAVSRIYASGSPKTVIAGFAPYVVEAYRMGDEAARRILEKAAREAALAIKAVASRIGYPGSRIGFTGGFYLGARDVIKPLIVAETSRALGRRIEAAEPIAPTECALVLHRLGGSRGFDEEGFIRACRGCG